LALLTRNWLRYQDRLSRLSLEWSALIAVMALAQLLLITVSDGILDLTKHAYLFNLLFDYMLVLMFTHLLAFLIGAATKAEPKAEEPT
jgi:DNA invertase Pin-like site-specific DNA recombinase